MSPSKVEAWLIGALGGEGAGPVDVAVGQRRRPPAVRVVPAAIEVVAREVDVVEGVAAGDRAARRRRRARCPDRRVPAVYVQLWVVRIVPARVERARRLVDDERAAGRRLAVVAAPVRVWAPAPSIEQRGRPARIGRAPG